MEPQPRTFLKDTESRCFFRSRNSNSRMKRNMCVDRHRRFGRCGVCKTACFASTTPKLPFWPCTVTVQCDQLGAVDSFSKCNAVFPFILYWLQQNIFEDRGAIKLRTVLRNLWCANSKKGYGEVLENVRIELCMNTFAWDQDRSALWPSNFQSPTKAWAKLQVAVGLWMDMYGYFSLTTNLKVREVCYKNNNIFSQINMPEFGGFFFSKYQAVSRAVVVSAGKARLKASCRPI